MKKKNILIPVLLGPAFVIPTIVVSASCSNDILEEIPITDHLNVTLKNEKYMDLWDLVQNTTKSKTIFTKYSKEIGEKYSGKWYRNLRDANWNYANPQKPIGLPLNLHCSTAKQALALYCNAWGEFWNIELHQNRIPIDKPNYKLNKGFLFPEHRFSILGKDYQLISNSLSDSSIPENTVTYHGVEFMEVEYWNQLKDYITQNSDGTYNYSNCKGQKITSYGFISTTLDKKWASDFSEGEDWVNGGKYLPLKEKFVFKIFIPKNINGVAYTSYFNFMDTINIEDQILIDRNAQFEIVDYYKDGENNYFDLLYLGKNEVDEIS